jgi:hypothetical protein
VTSFNGQQGAVLLNPGTLNVRDVLPGQPGAKGDAKNDIFSTVTCTAGSATLTISNADFAAADVGKRIAVDGCGATDSTGGISVVPVLTQGGGYTGVPSVALSGAGSGAGASLVPTMALVSATLVSGGSGCTPNGTDSFQVPLVVAGIAGANGTQAAQFSGTVTGGVLAGALTVTQAGATLALPTGNASTLPINGATCATWPVVSMSYGVGAIVAAGVGKNYPATVTASLTGGSPVTPATLGTPTIKPVTRPWSGSIAGYVSPTSVTLSGNATTSQAAVNAVTWGSDDTAAITAVNNIALSRASAGGATTIYYPAGNYLITARLPTFSKASVAVKGDGAYRSNLILDPAYAGPALSWSETWTNSGLPGTSPAASLSTVFAGAHIDGMSVYGDGTSANEQDALVFYDRNDYAVVRDFSAMHVSRFLYSGVALNTAVGLLRESYFSDMYCVWCGSAVTPNIELGTVSGTGDQTNNITFRGVNLWGVRGPGVVIRTPSGSERRLRFFGLRVEKDAGTDDQAGDLLQIGDRSMGGTVSDVSVYAFTGNSPAIGSNAIGLYADTLAHGPTDILIEGSINNSGAAIAGGTGLNIQAGTQNRFMLQGLTTNQFGLAVGPSTLVGANNFVSAMGQETSWPLSIDPSCLTCFIFPNFTAGITDPAANNTLFGTNALAANVSGVQSTALGAQALQSATAGFGNTAIGSKALLASTASNNTVVGYLAGSADTIGGGNTILGTSTGTQLTTGTVNTILGRLVGSTTLATGTNNILIGTNPQVDTPLAGSNNMLNIGGLLFANINSLAAPAVSACGTTPAIDANANNRSGTITVGTATPASCTMTFAGTGYASWNHCRVMPHATLVAFAYAYTKTTLTLTGTALSGAIDYDCDGY